MKMQNFEKNSKLNCGKTAYLRAMKFLILIHEVKSTYAKSYDGETHCLEDMAKNTFFAFFGHFLGFLGQKTYLAFDI